MAHDHTTDSSSTFGLSLILNTGFTIFEMTVGIASGSLALVADASHNLTDSLTLGIAYIAERFSRRAADDRQSYGYGRVKIIASLLNAGILVAIALFIGYEAVIRLGSPKDVPGLLVSAVAAVGIVINGFTAYLLSKQRHNLNAKSAYTNMFYDTLSSVGALLAGFAMALFGWNWLDSVVGIAIAIMLLVATFSIIREALHILLEGVPEGIDMAKLKGELMGLKYVFDVDDMHAWMIDSNYYAFSCHLVVDEKDYTHSRATVEEAKKLLSSKYKFKHSTVEVEFKDCTEHDEHEVH